MINYSEIFFSIQGEGVLSGVPSIFFRTSGCPLKCWFCDTKYTSHSPEKNIITTSKATSMIAKMMEVYNCDYLILTGGEPMSQHKAITTIIKKLREKNKNIHITIETAGIIFEPMDIDLFSISPKLSGSGPTENQIPEGKKWGEFHEKSRINIQALNQFIGTGRYKFKFVVTNPKHICEIKELQQTLSIPNDTIYLMPEGTTAKDIEQHQEFIVEECLKNGWRYSDRLHVRIWNDKRGV